MQQHQSGLQSLLNSIFSHVMCLLPFRRCLEELHAKMQQHQADLRQVLDDREAAGAAQVIILALLYVDTQSEIQSTCMFV